MKYNVDTSQEAQTITLPIAEWRRIDAKLRAAEELANLYSKTYNAAHAFGNNLVFSREKADKIDRAVYNFRAAGKGDV